MVNPNNSELIPTEVQIYQDLYTVLLAKETVNKLRLSGLLDESSADFSLWSIEEEIDEYIGILYERSDIYSVNSLEAFLDSQAKKECDVRWKSAL